MRTCAKCLSHWSSEMGLPAPDWANARPASVQANCRDQANFVCPSCFKLPSESCMLLDLLLYTAQKYRAALCGVLSVAVFSVKCKSQHHLVSGTLWRFECPKDMGSQQNIEQFWSRHVLPLIPNPRICGRGCALRIAAIWEGDIRQIGYATTRII